MSAPRSPRGKGRPWIQMYTTLLADTELILAGQDARALYPWLLLHSAEQGLNGLVPANPREVQLFAHLDGGPAACAAALDALLECDKLVRVDSKHHAIRSWDAYQADLGGSQTRSASMSAAKYRTAHNKGAHVGREAEKADAGCELCAQGVAPVPATDAPEPSPVLADPAPDNGPQNGAQAPARPLAASAPDKRTMKAALADFTDAIPAALAECATPFEGYRALLVAADEFAAVLADLSDNPRGALRNAVLGHALRNLVDPELPQAALNRAYRAAKALGNDGHEHWVTACVQAAGKEFEDASHTVNWMTTVAQTSRSKAVSA